MLVSYNWLKSLVDLDGIAIEEIAKRLTFAGVEVEEIYKLSTATNLIVGKVIKCEAVPDTHLHLCEVDLGPKHQKTQIICGAPNVRANLKVIVALPGAKLPGGEIKVTTIRGFTSNGMLCSLLELGVDSKYVSPIDLTGIHELSDEFTIGDSNVLDRLGLDDTILNLKLLANRPDLLSIYNVAREVATLFNKKIKPLPKTKFNEVTETFNVNSLSKKCPQFSARIIRNIKVGESPLELKKYLIAMGVRPINNIVDIGNYIMLLTGQPLHMYDYDKLPKKELIVKSDYHGDFIALDEKKYALNDGDIVVTSNNEVMCLGGVMGGLSSANSQTTTNIVIEAANFDYASIRRTSTRLNLISESSMRFTHGINPSQYNGVLDLATLFIKKYCGCSSISKIITFDTINHQEKIIHASFKTINNILATSYSPSVIKNTLTKDYFKIKNVRGNTFDAVVPAHRIDVDGVNDLAEEVVRILGFNDVKNELPQLQTSIGIYSDKQRKTLNIRKHLRSLSLYEVLTYVLVNAKRSQEFHLLNTDTPYKIINPMTDDHAYVRTNLIPSLLDVASYNLAHQNKDFGIFEVSDVNHGEHKDVYLGVVLTGNHKLQGELKKEEYSFYYLKGILESIMEQLGIEKNRYQLQELDLNNRELHPTRSANVIINRNRVAYLGELHPNNYATYNIKNNRVYVMEINLSALLDLPTGSVRFKAISRFPSVTRDLALLVAKNQKVIDIYNIIKRNGGNLVKRVAVFDIYKDSTLLDKKSVAVSISIANDNATLKDNEINETIERIKTALLKEGISIR